MLMYLISDCPSENSLVHTSKCATLQIHDFTWKRHKRLIFAGLVEQSSCDHGLNLQLCVTFPTILQANNLEKSEV